MIRVQEALAGICPPRMYIMTYIHATWSPSLIIQLFLDYVKDLWSCLVGVCFFVCILYMYAAKTNF